MVSWQASLLLFGCVNADILQQGTHALLSLRHIGQIALPGAAVRWLLDVSALLLELGVASFW